MSLNLVPFIFGIILAAESVLLSALFFSWLLPDTRIWPPDRVGGWRWCCTLVSMAIACAGILVLVALSWRAVFEMSPARIVVGLTLAVFGRYTSFSGNRKLRLHMTFGGRETVVMDGIYAITRNPQYVGDVMALLGLLLLTNLPEAWVAIGLFCTWFLAAPFVEEPWLVQQYGNMFREYAARVPRFLTPRGLARLATFHIKNLIAASAPGDLS